MLGRLEEPGVLDDAPTLLALWLDLAQAWNAPAPAEGMAADPVLVTGALRLAGPGQLIGTVEVSLSALGKLLGRMNKTTRND